MFTYSALITASFLFFIGVRLLTHTIKRWNRPEKQEHKFNELVTAILFFINSYVLLIAFESTKAVELQIYNILIIWFGSITVLFIVFNVFPHYLKLRKNPKYRKENTYENFLIRMDKVYASKDLAKKNDKIKNTSRKSLHLLQFTFLIIIHNFLIDNPEISAKIGLDPIEYRNFLLYFIGVFFWIMMMTGDLTRIENWKILPRWAHWWFEKSLDFNKEKYTFNASITILLSNFIFLNQSFPVQISFIAIFISCISDSMASIIGKEYGKHKLKIGPFPEKSIEGVIGGVITTFVGVLGIFIFYPLPGENVIQLYFLIATLCSIAVALIDIFIKKISDNIMNSVIPALITFSLIYSFF